MLTNDIKRLCGEIVTLRKERGEMLDDLAHECQARQHSVAELCGHFHSTRVAMARQTRHDRLAFVKHLKHIVQTHTRQFRSDLAGARKAWAGLAV
jgi:hypothetical protein